MTATKIMKKSLEQELKCKIKGGTEKAQRRLGGLQINKMKKKINK